jgi:hypothetical protein
MKAARFFGKRWTLERNTPGVAWVTDSISAVTVEVRADGWTSDFGAWTRVPPYIRAIVHRGFGRTNRG